MATKRTRPSPAPAAEISSRLQRVRDEMQRRKLDGYLVVDRMDQFWLTGFTGEDGGVLVTPRAVVLLTDGRFDQTADLEAPWARKVVRKQRGPDSIAKVVRAHKVRRLGFEPAHVRVAQYAELNKLIRPGRLAAASGLILELRRCKDAREVAAIREAIRVAQEAFADLQQWVRPGMKEREVAARLSYEMRCRGAQGDAFEPIVAVGANGSLPHYEPGDAVVNERQGLLVDWGCRRGWYVSDLTRMVWPGSIPPELRKAYAAAVEAHDRAIEAVRPGASAEAIDRVARNVIRKAGFDKQFNHALGHGIGLDVHEAPRLGKRSKDVLKAGMVVTIEPGIYLPGVGGVRVEDDVLVTDSGHEVLSSLPT